ncbi:hypothetical protein DVH24_013856 [Malus domestica]|uniref:Uncharacterized protein n=1 Tax=Malus domestica TaxID=3750 RepID=A0A498JCP8_MALDO|nr:hypothetical protein DVH24_013856 [Malus domestica]
MHTQVHGRNGRSPERLNWFLGKVITKAQRTKKNLRLVRARFASVGHPSSTGCEDPLEMVDGVALSNVPWSVQAFHSSENQDWTMEIIDENDEFRPNYMTSGRVFFGKINEEDLGFRPEDRMRTMVPKMHRFGSGLATLSFVAG